MKKFEYAIVNVKTKKNSWKIDTGVIDENQLSKDVNEMGSQGWELVSSIPNAQGLDGRTTEIVLIFKREKPD